MTETDAIKYYNILLNGAAKIGLLYAPDNCPSLHGKDGVQFPDVRNMCFDLREGAYADYMGSDVGGKFVSKELMELFKTYLKPFEKVEFIPVSVKSAEYGDKTYYIMHFEEVYDVIDRENSKYIESTGDLVVPRLDYYKVKDMDVFNIAISAMNLIVSEKVRREMRRRKMADGIEFYVLWCLNKNTGENEMRDIREKVKEWLRGIAKSKSLPKDVVAVNIGMFDTEGGYGVYLCGATEYDRDDSDWACEPVYELPDDYLMLQGPGYASTDWEDFQDEMVKVLKDILDKRENEEGNLFSGLVSRVKSTFGNSENDTIERFFGTRIVTTGFDDGDLIRIR